MYGQILKEIQESYYQSKFSNDGQRFVAWYLRNIYLRDINQAKDDITDGQDDKQIDAVFIDDDKQTIFIIQGKFIGADTVDAEPLREVLSSWVQIKDLVRLQEFANDKLKRKLSEVARALEEDYEIEFELVSTARLTSAAEADLATYQQQFAKVSDSEGFVSNLSVVDSDEIRRRYDMAAEAENPSINYTVDMSSYNYMNVDLSGTSVLVAILPLTECIKIPGIKDGTLFQKNVRQSLGLGNQVNKGMRATIYGSNANDFFFYHNGVTAICNEIKCVGTMVTFCGLSVVNGCQSLNTLLSCSEKVKEVKNACILFRFYEIPQRERGDKISVNTNSQSAVKPRDLRSNDKYVLSLKKKYEQKYHTGYLVTKRGERALPDRDSDYVLDLSDLGKYLVAWHSQRPNIAYSEARIFDKYFDQLFKRDYDPEDAQSLFFWMKKVLIRWEKSNPLGLNESLLAMRAYAPFHHLYAISLCFCVSNNISEGVPCPTVTWNKAIAAGLVDQLVDISGSCLNSALEAAANEPIPSNRVFSPQNWIKTKTCLAGIRAAIRQYFSMLPTLPMGGKDLSSKLQLGLKMEPSEFQPRWAAD